MKVVSENETSPKNGIHNVPEAKNEDEDSDGLADELKEINKGINKTETAIRKSNTQVEHVKSVEE
jgi:hypothetical protein